MTVDRIVSGLHLEKLSETSKGQADCIEYLGSALERNVSRQRQRGLEVAKSPG